MEDTEKERQGLMQKLLDSVKQCQVDFGGKTILATDSHSSVSCLLHHFETAFQHGLKKNKMIEMISSISEPFRQVTQKMLPEYENSFWPFIKDHLLLHDVQFYQNMDNIVTDTGKGRVWLRTAINEHSLERNLTAFLADKTILRQHYEPWALFLDEERSSTLPIMARGLEPIFFATNTKDEDLNKPLKTLKPKASVPLATKAVKTHRRVNSSPLPIMAGFDTEPTIMKKINVKKKRKKKVLEATISNLDDEINEHDKLSLSQSLGEKELTYKPYKSILKNKQNFKSYSVDNYLIKDDIDSPVQGISSTGISCSDYCKDIEVDPSGNVSQLNNADSNGVSAEVNDYSQALSERLQNINNLNTITNATSDTIDVLDTVSTSNHNLLKSESAIPENGLRTDTATTKTTAIVERQNQNQLEFNSYNSTKENTNDDCKVDASHHHRRYDVAGENIVCDDISDVIGDEYEVINAPLKPLLDRSSSSSDITTDDFEPMLTVGSHSTSDHIQILTTYDQESHQAANDTMALLLTTSYQSTDMFSNQTNTDEEKNKSSVDIEKYVKSSDCQVSENLSNVDLKQAILSTVKKKDEVEKRNKALQSALEEQRELNSNLQNEFENLQNESLSKETLYKKKTQDMTKEIDVLKNQLKKYVAAVQMLRNDKILSAEAKEAIGNLRAPIDEIVIPPKPKERTTSENDSIFEDKLAQMAEMHGELLELQSVLQKQMIARDHENSRMKQELISLRGPLPELKRDSSDPSALSNSSDSLYVIHPTLINIWIPSVFLKGKGADAHHLYQIYVRIGDEEWNIYRRYSQFNKLHGQVGKEYSTLEKFNFPKKKMFGKKDIKFVEERRRKLQEYLRFLINTCISNNTNLTSHTSKSDLTRLLPFFSEQFGVDNQKKQSKKKSDKSSPQYNGL